MNWTATQEAIHHLVKQAMLAMVYGATERRLRQVRRKAGARRWAKLRRKVRRIEAGKGRKLGTTPPPGWPIIRLKTWD